MKLKLYSKLAKVYDEIYQQHFDYDKQAEFVDGILRKRNAKKVLEIGCGTGHLTERLAKLGYQVTGADLSREMLAIARARNSKIDYREQDMRNLRLNDKYDAVVILGRSFTYMTTNQDARQALNSIYSVLNDKGVLIFDNFNAQNTINNIGKYKRYVDEFDLGNKQVKRISGSTLKAAETIQFKWNCRYEITENGKVDVETDESMLRAFLKSELELLLEIEGFKVIDFIEDDFAFVAEK